MQHSDFGEDAAEAEPEGSQSTSDGALEQLMVNMVADVRVAAFALLSAQALPVVYMSASLRLTR